MHPTSNTYTPSHPTTRLTRATAPPATAQRLLALHLIRVRERAGLSREQMAQRTDYSPHEIETIETGASAIDLVELRAWCRAVGTPLVEFVREFDAALRAEETREQSRNEAEAVQKAASNICLLRFSPGGLPTLLIVENAPQTVLSLLGTTEIRVFATGNPEMLGLSCAASTEENSARGADEQLECMLLHPTEAFLVVAGSFEGAQVSPSAPRNQGLDEAPLAAYVPLCPHALDLTKEEDRQRFSLRSLSPLQVESALDRFAPRLSDGAVEDIMNEHPDGEV